MRRAEVSTWGQRPALVEVPSPPPPGLDEVRIAVEAIGVHRVVRARAAGKHYSAGALPHVPGIDGVGTTENGQRVYFSSFTTGTLAEEINVPRATVFPLPEGVDPLQVAGVINPCMSSWMAFKGRTTDLPSDFTCLIIGATSASGRVAIPLARSLGAKKVIGVARNQSALDTLDLDHTIRIADQVEETNFSELDEVDVVLDYVYGPLATHLFRSLKTPKPVQYVHIGALSEPDISIPGEVLRSKDISIRGSGPGAWTMASFSKTLPDLLKAMISVPAQKLKIAKVEDLESEWDYAGSDRLVFII